MTSCIQGSASSDNIYSEEIETQVELEETEYNLGEPIALTDTLDVTIANTYSIYNAYNIFDPDETELYAILIPYTVTNKSDEPEFTGTVEIEMYTPNGIETPIATIINDEEKGISYNNLGETIYSGASYEDAVAFEYAGDGEYLIVLSDSYRFEDDIVIPYYIQK
jgi:hypothetical protein